MPDWFDSAMKEFMLDLWTFTGTVKEDAEKIYSYLASEGLIDYDELKEYLFSNYVEEIDGVDSN